jgi:DNA-binding response OmpR family regulator
MKKILIIEDDSVILFGLKAKFSSLGVLALAMDGTQEIKDIMFKIKKERPDYLILDLILPKIEGFQLLKEIKSEMIGWRMPVFVFSNLTDQDSKQRCENMGADYYFVKTDFNIDEFAEKVIKIINNLGLNKI